jgi:hypothetical protein
MTRVRPDDHLIIGVVNYGSISVRTSRLIYLLARRPRLARRDVHLFWDSPVRSGTFECTYRS